MSGQIEITFMRNAGFYSVYADGIRVGTVRKIGRRWGGHAVGHGRQLGPFSSRRAAAEAVAIWAANAPSPRGGAR